VELLLFAPLSALLALLFAGLYAKSILKEDPGTPKMQEIGKAIQEGSKAYLNRQYKTITVFAVLISGALFYLINLPTAIGFVVGAFFSALAGYIGMNISVRANVRTANKAKEGLNKALGLAFKGGSVTGLAVVGLSLLGISLFYWIYRDPFLIVGFGFGASLISLFARIGGGIYTKAADVGADLVGKVEAGIPEDDPRNPAVIADNVGDNVGDCAGMGADLFETYAVTAIAAILLGSIFFQGEIGMIYPLMLGAVAILASIIGTFFVKIKEDGSIMRGLYKALIVSGVVAAIGFYFVTDYMGMGLKLYYTTLVGLAIVLIINVVIEYYTSKKYGPVKSIADASQTGAGTNVITGLAIGLQSTAVPTLVISAGILISYWLAGLYGIAIAAMAMLSLTGIIVALDSYGPITDNAGGIAEMANLPAKTRKITDSLDAVGNTTKAVTKGYAIGSAALAALALFAAYTEEIGEGLVLEISSPLILVGLFLGGLLPFLFSSYLMRAVGRAASEIVKEVRRQFKDIKGIMEGKAKPDYGRCVDIVTIAAQKEMVIPALLAVLSPLVVGFILGPAALGAMLLGVIVTGLLLAIQMTTGGASWDNAKKYIEDGKYGGKGSDAHKAAVVGDTVGDPYKDAAGPAINPLIKVMNTIAIIFVHLIVLYALV
jgi:K(+)-stimulated pyrophosphate-energized sodium pump